MNIALGMWIATVANRRALATGEDVVQALTLGERSAYALACAAVAASSASGAGGVIMRSDPTSPPGASQLR
jgi:hypothetical protein